MSRVERTLEQMAEIGRELVAVTLQAHAATAETHTATLEMQAANREMQVTNREMQAANREMQAQHRAWQEADRVQREAERAQREAEWAQREAEWARQEAASRVREQEEREARRKWGELANKMGTLVEDIVAPGIPTVFQTVFGRDRFEATYQRMRRTHATDRGREREFDYVVVTRDLVLITQTKSTLRPGDIRLLLMMLRGVRDYLPEYRDRQFVGALASFSVDPSLVVAGERRGLLMFGLGTGLLQVLNTPGFRPTRF